MNKVGNHRQCQLSSVVSEWASRFGKNSTPNAYEIDEMFRLHGVYQEKLTKEEKIYFNEEMRKQIGRVFLF